MLTPARRRAGSLVLLVCLGATALSGCSGDDPAPDEPSSTAVTSTPDAPDPTSGSPSVDPSEDPTPDPTPDATPDTTPESTYADVEPATGELVELDGLSLRVPVGYQVLDSTGDLLNAQVDPAAGFDFLGVSATGNYDEHKDLDAMLATHNERDISYRRDPTTRDRVVVDGVEMYHASGKVSPQLWAEAFGGGNTAYDIDIAFAFGLDTPAAERQRITESVMASIDLT